MKDVALPGPVLARRDNRSDCATCTEPVRQAWTTAPALARSVQPQAPVTLAEETAGYFLVTAPLSLKQKVERDGMLTTVGGVW